MSETPLHVCLKSELLDSANTFVKVLVLGVGVVFACCGLANAQVSTADIVGSVQDQSGAVIPNAPVTLVSVETKQQRTAQASGTGLYTFTLLPPGHYRLSITYTGFKEYVADNVILSGGDRVRVDAKLEVGQTSEKIEVTSESPALQAESSSLGSVVTQQAVEDLPLNGRNIIQLAQLAPGANEGPSVSIGSGTRAADRRQSSSLAVNGQSDLANNQLIDGADNNDAIFGVLGARPSVDAIQEFRVLTSLYPAEVGRTGGGVVNLITKSGTTQLHGSLYEFLRNDVLDARDFFTKASGSSASAKPKYIQNQFGGSLGGPLSHNTFFFGDYEGLRIVQGQPTTVTVPTLFEEQNPGNLSDIGGPILATINPIALNYFKLFPAPLPGAGTVNNFTFSPKRTQYSTTTDGRVDHTLRSGDTIFARETFNDVSTFTPPQLPIVNGINPGGAPTAYSGESLSLAHNALLGYTHVFTPNLLGEFRASYNRVYNSTQIGNPGQNLSTQFGINGINVDSSTYGLTPQVITGYASLGDSPSVPILNTSNTIQLAGSITYNHGPHSIKTGMSYIRRGGRNQQNAFGLGLDYYIATPTGFPLASFLTGRPALVERTNQVAIPNLRTSEISEYAQDDLKVTKNLTLNLGVRYDIFTPLTETSNHLSTFDPATDTILQAGVNGVSRSVGVKTDYSNVAPRIGFAESVTSKTVIRGGFSLAFSPSAQLANYVGDPPYNFTYAPSAFSVTLSTPYPVPTASSTTALTGSLNVLPRNLRSQYIEQFSLNMQQEIGRNVLTAAYVGSLGRHVGQFYNINSPPLTNSASYVSLEPFHAALPNVNTITERASGGVSNYNALQFIGERRTNRGLTLSANYTYARNLGNVTSFSDNALSQGNGIVPSKVSTLDYGNSDLDIRHRATGQINYKLPFAVDRHGVTGVLAKGWQVNAIEVWQTGTAFTVADTVGQAYPGNPSDRPNVVANPLAGSCPQGDAVGSLNCFFNTAAFQQQKLGTVGVLRSDTTTPVGTIGPYAEERNQLYGPHFRHLDLSLFKDFKLKDRYMLQFRAESFNLTNTPNFAQPISTISAVSATGTPLPAATDGGFGTINATRIGANARLLQFALRLTF